MHAGPVVLEQGLGHERRRHAVGVGHVLDHVLVLHQVVGHVRKGGEAHGDLGLAAGGHLMVVAFHGDADLLHGEYHLGADVLHAVRGRAGEVAFLGARLVAQVGVLLLARRPVALGRIDGMEGEVGALPVAHVVEHEELGFGAEIGHVGDAAAFQMGLRLLRDVAGIAAVRLPGHRIAHVADQHQGRHRGEGIEERGLRVGDHHHVAFLNLLEAADRGSVEADTLVEDIRVDAVRRHREVLPGAGKVREAHVHHADVVVLYGLEDIVWVFAVQRHGWGSSSLISAQSTHGGFPMDQRLSVLLDGIASC